MRKQRLWIAGSYEADGHVFHIGLVKRGVVAGVTKHLVEIPARQVIFRAFVFKDVEPLEYPSNVLFDN